MWLANAVPNKAARLPPRQFGIFRAPRLYCLQFRHLVPARNGAVVFSVLE
jgi:hypothetical protein